MGLEPIDVEKMDFGPCILLFGDDYMGRSQGETKTSYSIDTDPLETEEDGKIDEIVKADLLTVVFPGLYTDADTLAISIPWATKNVDGSGNKNIIVGRAIGKRLSTYAKPITIHPLSAADNDKSKDVTVYKCYPKPGPIDFGYSRTSKRIANVTFNAISNADGNYFCIGDPSIGADTTAPSVSSISPLSAATGVDKDSGLHIEFTLSEAINPATIIKDNTSITNITTGVPFTDYTVSYFSDTHKIRLTTGSALDSTTEYIAVLGTGITDLNGNHLATPKVANFTTGS